MQCSFNDNHNKNLFVKNIDTLGMAYKLYFYARGWRATNISNHNKKHMFSLRVASTTLATIQVQFYQVFDLRALCHVRDRWTTNVVLCEPQVFRLVIHIIKRTKDVSRLPQKIWACVFFYCNLLAFLHVCFIGVCESYRWHWHQRETSLAGWRRFCNGVWWGD